MISGDRREYLTIRVPKGVLYWALSLCLIGGGTYFLLPRYSTPYRQSSEEIRVLRAIEVALEGYYADYGSYPPALSRETLSPYIRGDYISRVVKFLARECLYIPDTKAITYVLVWRGPDGQFQVDRAAVESATDRIALNRYLETITFPIGDIFKTGHNCRESLGDRN